MTIYGFPTSAPSRRQRGSLSCGPGESPPVGCKLTSQMIFPRLEKESPTTSIHQEAAPAKEQQHEAEDFEDFVEEDAELEDDNSEDGFLTDEEYDILDASDEEYLAEQEKAAKK